MNCVTPTTFVTAVGWAIAVISYLVVGWLISKANDSFVSLTTVSMDLLS